MTIDVSRILAAHADLAQELANHLDAAKALSDAKAAVDAELASAKAELASLKQEFDVVKADVENTVSAAVQPAVQVVDDIATKIEAMTAQVRQHRQQFGI